MPIGERGCICDIPVILEQFLGPKSVQKRGQYVDKNKDQKIKETSLAAKMDFSNIKRVMGDFCSVSGARDKAQDDFSPKEVVRQFKSYVNTIT